MMEENKEIINEPDIENEDSGTGVLMDKPFDPTLIKIETKTPSLDTLIRRIKGNSVQLNTETYFQRQNDLWDKTKQSRLIESILIRFPLPAFFFDATDDNNWLIVDGLQRLSSIRNFVVNKTQPLTDMEFLTHLNGKYWDELPENLQRLIEESQVVIYKILPGTPNDVKFNIFKRINTGGLVLEPQEIRHALFQGRPAVFIHELAKMEDFKKATGYKIATHRMLDRDFANRFLGFYLLGVANYGTKEFGLDLDSYMSNSMGEIYDKNENELSKIKADFKKAMQLSYSIFGREAFRKVRGSYDRLPPINKALFDALSTQLALLTSDEAERLQKNGKIFRELLSHELAVNNDFFMSVTSATGDKGKVSLRHSKVKALIFNSI